MVSMPRAKRCSLSGEKTATRSCSTRGRNAAVQSWLSRPDSPAIVSQRSAVVEIGNSLDRAVYFGFTVRERDEHALDLARRDVDTARQQVAEQRAVTADVGELRVVEVVDGRIGHEERHHR